MLTDGVYLPLQTYSTFFSFARQNDHGAAIVMINAGDSPIALNLPVNGVGLPDGTRFIDVLDDQRQEFVLNGGHIHFEQIHPGWGRVLIQT